MYQNFIINTTIINKTFNMVTTLINLSIVHFIQNSSAFIFMDNNY